MCYVYTCVSSTYMYIRVSVTCREFKEVQLFQLLCYEKFSVSSTHRVTTLRQEEATSAF